MSTRYTLSPRLFLKHKDFPIFKMTPTKSHLTPLSIILISLIDTKLNSDSLRFSPGISQSGFSPDLISYLSWGLISGNGFLKGFFSSWRQAIARYCPFPVHFEYWCFSINLIPSLFSILQCSSRCRQKGCLTLWEVNFVGLTVPLLM